jgi:hypothetical protein
MNEYGQESLVAVERRACYDFNASRRVQDELSRDDARSLLREDLLVCPKIGRRKQDLTGSLLT